MSAGKRSDSLSAEPHRRLNLLTGEWVLVSPHRSRRPWQGLLDSTEQDDRPSYDPGCYLCPGNERAAGLCNPVYAGRFLFHNDFAALESLAGSPSGRLTNDELLVAVPESGTCRVLCFSPRHDLSLPTLSLPEIRALAHIQNVHRPVPITYSESARFVTA